MDMCTFNIRFRPPCANRMLSSHVRQLPNPELDGNEPNLTLLSMSRTISLIVFNPYPVLAKSAKVV